MPEKSKCPMRTRAIIVEGAMTTVSLEDDFWRDLEAIARQNDLTVAELLSLVEDCQEHTSDLSSAVRAYVSTNRSRH